MSAECETEEEAKNFKPRVIQKVGLKEDGGEEGDLEAEERRGGFRPTRR